MGSTGRGKTVSVIESWACREILSQRSTILIGGKGDPEILVNIQLAAQKSPRKPEVLVFDLGNPEASCATNPLEHGSAQQITDRIFTAFTFEDPYFRSVQYDATASLVMLIKECEEIDPVTPKTGVTFNRLYQLFTDDLALSEAIAQSRNEILRAKLTRHLSMPKSVREEKFSGIISQLAPFAVGEVAQLVNGATAGRESSSVSRILLPTEHDEEYRYQFVFVLLIPKLKYHQLGHQLGKLIIQEIGWAVRERASQKVAGKLSSTSRVSTRPRPFSKRISDDIKRNTVISGFHTC